MEGWGVEAGRAEGATRHAVSPVRRARDQSPSLLMQQLGQLSDLLDVVLKDPSLRDNNVITMHGRLTPAMSRQGL